MSSNTGNLIADLVAMQGRHAATPFLAGETSIPVSGKVFGGSELTAAVPASLDFWLTSGPYSEKFESKFAKTVGMRHSCTTSTGNWRQSLANKSDVGPVFEPKSRLKLGSGSRIRTLEGVAGEFTESESIPLALAPRNP